MTKTAEQKAFLRELIAKISIFTHGKLETTLKLINIHILEMEDALFHHNSAVVMPEGPKDKSNKKEQDKVTGIKTIALIFKELEFDPDKRITIAGHTDTSGEDKYNFQLSELRAQNVLYLIIGDRDKWVDVSYSKHKVEDYQQILAYIKKTRGWRCGTGKVDNKCGMLTRAGIRNFIKNYNKKFVGKFKDKDVKDFDPLPNGLVSKIKKDPNHKWPKVLWAAVFNMYNQDICDTLLIKPSQLAVMQKPENLKFADDNHKYVGCGESFPIDEAQKDNYRSQGNRRVEILMFDKDEAPVLDCPAQIKKKHKEEECPLYNKYHFMPLYIDPRDLHSVAYHFCFRYYNKVSKKYVDVSEGLKIKAFEENDKGVTFELETVQEYRKKGDNGVYYVKVRFKTALDDGTHKKLHFEFKTKAPTDTESLWVFTKNKTTDPEIVKKNTESIIKLPYRSRYKYYDLPAKWSSKYHWTRYDGDMKKGDVFDKVLRVKKKFKPFGSELSKPDKPMIFCLDDVILTDKNFKPLTQPVGNYNASILDNELAVIDPDSDAPIFKSYYTKNGIKIKAGFLNVRVPVPDKRLGGVILKHNVAPKYKLFGIFEDRVPANYDVCGHRAAVYEHKEKCLLVKRFTQRHQRAYKNIGRFDSYLLRDQDVNDKGEEISYIFNYFRWYLVGANPPVISQTWIDTAITNLTNEWNDKTNNQLIYLHYKKDRENYRINIRYHIEQVPDADKETKVTVNPAGAGGRSNMGRVTGEIKLDETTRNAVTKSFTAAHEYGHATSLDDDYIETVNDCSFFRPGVVDFKEGGPFLLDENAMMKSNKEIRSRYMWHFAAWMHKKFIKNRKIKFKVIRKNKDDFILPYNPTNPFDPGDMAKEARTYVNYPWKDKKNATNTKSTQPYKGKFHQYLYPLGKDEYSQGGLYGANNFTGLLVVIVNLHFVSWTGNPNLWTIYDNLNKFNTAIDDKFRKNNGIRIDGLKPLERTFVQVVPRYLVKNYPADYTTTFPSVNNAAFTAAYNAALAKPEGTPHLNIKIITGNTAFDRTKNPPELKLKNTNTEFTKFWKYFSHTLGLEYGKTLNKNNFAVGNFVPNGTVENL